MTYAHAYTTYVAYKYVYATDTLFRYNTYVRSYTHNPNERDIISIYINSKVLKLNLNV